MISGGWLFTVCKTVRVKATNRGEGEKKDQSKIP
jgi:hypothetical protein